MRPWILFTTLFVMLCCVSQASPYWGFWGWGQPVAGPAPSNRPPPSGEPSPTAEPTQAPQNRNPRPSARQPGGRRPGGRAPEPPRHPRSILFGSYGGGYYGNYGGGFWG
ncbi:hypothetical protein ANCCEY_02434 [Ancylostoma ceylanicum]|uniref:Uncharacterized protein n=1 Tax=Ancylostoma ceylanicum TaxID=53326 RepID=A0A0D6M2Y7_9BILA|nr:hypothetical protein ANCCEY_02434 [Ancylostoma ceylanicum]